jgi:glutamyl/glutaminyl-tRNA synthetase
MGPDHAPLSKRHGATSVAEFRAKGYLPEALVNYLALIGWSPGADDELLPAPELARRFTIEAVGHSAGVFDEEKLAWANRHYLRTADAPRLAGLAIRYLREAGFVADPDPAGLDYLASIVPMATGSVDRLEHVPSRLAFLFRFDPTSAVSSHEVADVLAHEGARAVIQALVRELAGAPRLVDRERFRAVVNAVRQQTGQKAKGLFHPIRVALTGEAGGPELDVAVPAIDTGASLPASSGIAPVLGCRERAAAFWKVLSDS